jgi:acyl-CoA thioesterase-2
VTATGFLASLLTVERCSESEFAARLHDYDGMSFGGDVLGRLALAAALTAGEKALHSFHATFLRPAPPGVLLRIRVARLVDGRRFARRRAALDHDGRLLCEATASFAAVPAGETGWQDVAMPVVPPPESLPNDEAVAEKAGWTNWNLEEEEFEWGFVGEPWRASEASGPAGDSRWSTWLRPRQPLPPDPRVHAAALVFASDYVSHWSASLRLGRQVLPGVFASLDQSVHIHRTPRWDDWWLLHNWSEIAHEGRALWHRQIFSRDGALVASIRQEALLADPVRDASS